MDQPREKSSLYIYQESLKKGTKTRSAISRAADASAVGDEAESLAEEVVKSRCWQVVASGFNLIHSAV
jgi:hypothetical protein